MMMENFDRSIKQWGQRCGVSARLAQFFKTKEAQALVREFSSLGVVKPDADVLIFLLIFVVWADEEWNKVPRDNKSQEVGKLLRQARRSLYPARSRVHPTSVYEVEKTIKQLEMCERHLNIVPWVQVGTMVIWGYPPRPKRQRGKRQVIFFLTGYFRELEHRHPPWKVIVKFLQLVGWEKPSRSSKTISTEWSTIVKREVTSVNPLEPHQQEWVNVYYQAIKNWVYEDPTECPAKVNIS
ncbi:hypothetical protein [Candidatus Nitronereus thalassa]|uniref:Uncharacterized protein n=1 Tax=Candidatus Nitronereus thalassa TaxID=3020898 RepID=A0ABU3K4A4_9BACT|nr:hypothetical protein [Candidatus Nitronereus thalassa]MDT7041222.1 hypothetical protein [Candidatus Nitronereus thalassa]